MERVYVEASAAAAFEAKVVELAKAYTVGPSTDAVSKVNDAI